MPKLTRGAKKQLEKLPPQLSTKAHELIRRLDGELHPGKKLVGPPKGKRTARLGRTHRIIYEETEGYVVVLTVGPRRDVYR